MVKISNAEKLSHGLKIASKKRQQRQKQIPEIKWSDTDRV